MVVHRFELNDGINEIHIARGAIVLNAQYQPAKGCISLWVMMDKDAGILEIRNFLVKATGDMISQKKEQLLYVGTAQESQGAVIWHVFEVLPIIPVD